MHLIIHFINWNSIFSCITCNAAVRAEILNSFSTNFVLMLIPLIGIGIITLALSIAAIKTYTVQTKFHIDANGRSIIPATACAIILGMGVGGFIDGIVLHQMLQWHEMFSNKLPPTNYVNKSVNMFWDGVFHVFTLLLVIIGIVLQWKLLYRRDIVSTNNLLAGGMLMGFGIFNIIEGVFDHHILKLHNVRENSTNPEFWNFGFLVISLVMIAIGYALVRYKSKKVVTQI